jgi:hypothetical protein
MARQYGKRHNADKVVEDHKPLKVGDLVKIKNSLETIGIISEVKGKIQAANHDWSKFYFMVIPMGAQYPIPVWGEELEIVRKA